MGSHRRTFAAALASALASLALYPIFLGSAWFFAGLGSIAVIALAGTLTRLRRLPAGVCLLIGLAALLLFLNAAFESARSWYHLVPNATSLRWLWDLAGTGFNQSAKYAPPVPELTGMLLLATAGIGLTALLTDWIAVRLESAALAGLPLLLLYTEPFTLSLSRSGLGTTLVFCAGVIGYLTLLSSEGKDRIREWERPDPGPEELPDTKALAMTGRRVGLASVTLALCVPLFVPGLHATRLFGGQPGIGGAPVAGGGGGVGFPDPNVQLSKELNEKKAEPVLTYTSSDSTPQYFQLYVLDNLTTSDAFEMFSVPRSVVPVDPNVPPELGLTNETYAITEQTTVTLQPDVGQDELAALPVPFPATSVYAQGNGLEADKNTLMIFDNGAQLAGLRYVATSLDETQTPTSLLDKAAAAPKSITDHYLEVPSSYDSLTGLADSIVAANNAKTEFQKAVDLQQWLSSGRFKYDTNTPAILNAAGLTNFLTTTKKGYCQQFSFAMAVLARLLGIPSRVAYGYTSGTSQTGDSWLVTTHDAHAWPELYFQGFGWMRFEPTPGGQDGQGTATAPTYTQGPADPFRATSPVTVPTIRPTSPSSGGSANVPESVRRGLNPFGNEGTGGLVPSNSNRLTAWDVLLLSLLSLLGLLAVVAAAPGGARLVIRRRRWRAGHRGGDAGLAHAAWRELRDDLVDYRVGYFPSESPRALAARVGVALELTGPAMEALRRIAMAEERARYAARADLGVGLPEDSAVVRRAIAAAASRQTRWLARLFPASVVGPAMIRAAQAVDFSGRLNPDWFGRSRLGSGRLGRAGFGHGRGGPSDSETAAGERAEQSEPPVGAGTQR